MDEIIKEERKPQKNKLKIGVLGCGYACHEYLYKRLNPWFNSAHNKDFVFSFVSARFSEYEQLGINQDNSETERLLKFLLEQKLINYLSVPEKSMSEAEARNLALEPLLREKCDYILILDLQDEIFHEGFIHNLLYFLNQDDNKLYTWFSITFKNYFGDGDTYLEDFCPPRVFKVDSGDKRLEKFYEDNGCYYCLKNDFEVGWSYKQLPNKIISKELVFPSHLSWINGQKSLEKYKYQIKRWNTCSYKVNDNGIVSIDKDYYINNGLKIPTILHS